MAPRQGGVGRALPSLNVTANLGTNGCCGPTSVVVVPSREMGQWLGYICTHMCPTLLERLCGDCRDCAAEAAAQSVKD